MKDQLSDEFGGSDPVIMRARGRVITEREETFEDMTDDDGNVVLNDDDQPRQRSLRDGVYYPCLYLKPATDTTEDDDSDS